MMTGETGENDFSVNKAWAFCRLIEDRIPAQFITRPAGLRVRAASLGQSYGDRPVEYGALAVRVRLVNEAAKRRLLALVPEAVRKERSKALSEFK